MTATATAAGLAPAADLDRFLGDPGDPASPMSFERALARDRAAEFPLEAAEALNEWGVHHYYVPSAFGGRLDDVLTPLLIMRNVARRDVTAAVGHGKTVLGAICAWAAADGSAEQMARIVLAGDPVSWGLTEQGRGSDIASSTTSAALGADGIVLDGHKWPIGNATRGRAVTVLARTDDRPGPAVALARARRQAGRRSDDAELSPAAAAARHPRRRHQRRRVPRHARGRRCPGRPRGPRPRAGAQEPAADPHTLRRALARRGRPGDRARDRRRHGCERGGCRHPRGRRRQCRRPAAGRNGRVRRCPVRAHRARRDGAGERLRQVPRSRLGRPAVPRAHREHRRESAARRPATSPAFRRRPATTGSSASSTATRWSISTS